MKDLTPKQLQAIPLMAQGKTGKEVAAEVSVAPQTLCEWRKSAIFMAELNNFKMELLETARSALQHAPNLAVAALVELAESSDNPETRRKAALDILRLTGFEPGQYEAYAWGIGQRTVEAAEHEINGTLNLYKLTKKYAV